MKILFIPTFLLLIVMLQAETAFCQTNALAGKTWSYKKLAIVYQQDTLVMFSADSAKNLWYLGRVDFRFTSSGTYTGTTTEGATKQGTWSIPAMQTFVVDNDTNQIVSLTSNQIKLSSLIHYQDDSTNFNGVLLTELYTTPPVTSECNSLQSGDWTAPSTWSCGHEPTLSDVAVINPGHTITVSTSTPKAQRVIYNGGAVKFSVAGTKILINGSN